MAKFLRVAATVLCVLSVLAICIAPFVDLPATNLPSDLLVVLLICWLIAVSSVLVPKTRKPQDPSIGILFGLPERTMQHALQPLDNNCVLQC